MLTDLIRGPLVWVAFGVFFAGLVLEGWRFFRLSHPKDRRQLPPEPPPAKPEKKPSFSWPRLWAWAGGVFEKWLRRMRRSMLLGHPFMLVVTVIFHTFLFVVPIFLFAHNRLFEQAFGVSLPSFADGVADAMTVVVLLCGGVFVWRRLFLRRVRAITGPGDWAALVVTLLPFVSGFVAYHQWGDYQTALTIHVATGEAMLMAIPFTKLGHMLYFFLYRLLLGGEYGFGQGSRAW